MQYEKIIDLSGSAALEVIDIINRHGEETALRIIENRFLRHKGVIMDRRPWTASDSIYSDDSPFVLAYNRVAGCVSLVRIILSDCRHTSGPWDDVEADPDSFGTYRVGRVAEEQDGAVTDAEKAVAKQKDIGNALLIKNACNALMKAAERLGVDAVIFAATFENAIEDGKEDLITALRSLIAPTP